MKIRKQVEYKNVIHKKQNMFLADWCGKTLQPI